jgi:6-phosphogluconolactonase
VFEDSGSLAHAGARTVVDAAQRAVRRRGSFTWVLSGGSTPKAAYALLAEDAALFSAMPWAQTHIYFGDERSVPPDHADSNFRMANEAMLSKVPIPSQQIHRIETERGPVEAAAHYHDLLRADTTVEHTANGVPAFDLLLLGFGVEGHTASLFPGADALDEGEAWVIPTWVGKLNTSRVTFTLPIITSAREILFWITGQDKALALKGALEGPSVPAQLPAQTVMRSAGNVRVYLDRSAAGLLERETLKP